MSELAATGPEAMLRPAGETVRRSPILYLAVLAAVIVVGLGSRGLGHLLPAILADYTGDTLWATMFLLIIALLRPRIPTARAAAWTLAICWGIELSQLYHAPLIDAIRGTPLGGLALGHTFLWSDIACCAIGTLLGVPLDMLLKRRSSHPR